jgi:hypothetical protein
MTANDILGIVIIALIIGFAIGYQYGLEGK